MYINEKWELCIQKENELPTIYGAQGNKNTHIYTKHKVYIAEQ